jgi:hypothetical protein
VRSRLVAIAAVAVLLLLLAAAPALAAGPQIRRRLEASIQKTLGARSLVARASAELEEGGGPRFPFLLFEERIENKPTRKDDIRRFAPGHRRHKPTNEVLVVGDSAWYRAKGPRYREATLGPGIDTGFEQELVGLERAVKAGKEVMRLGESRYELVAPSRTINGPEGGSGSIRLTFDLNDAGYLRQVRRIDELDSETSVFALERFTDYGRLFAITPPAPGAIAEGPVKEVTSQSEFSDLLGPPPFGND